MLLGGGDCYDPYEGNFYTSRGGVATTHNRFSQLADYNDREKEALHLKNAPDCPVLISDQEHSKKKQEDDYFGSLEEFINKNYKKLSINVYFID